MSLQVVKPTDEQIEKEKNHPAKSFFFCGERFRLTGTGWRMIEDTYFPVLETDCGSYIALSLFETKWDVVRQRPILPHGPMAEYFRKNAHAMTCLQMIESLYEHFKDKMFETVFCYCTISDQYNDKRKTRYPNFRFVEE